MSSTPKLDPIAEAFKIVRDATFNNDDISLSQGLIVLEMVAHEVRNELAEKMRREVMNMPG